MINIHQVVAGNILRDRREQLGLTTAQVADRIGVARCTITQWERGARNPRAYHLLPLLKVLKMPVPGWLKATHITKANSIKRRNELVNQTVDIELV